MVSGSGGIEPEFALSYTRRTDNLNESYKIETKVIKDYREITGNHGTLPEYFVSSADIPWKDRIKTQSIIQQHVDTAISSTVNLPKETTKEEIEKLYLYAWICKLKGITIFRDGCKRLGILTATDAPIQTQIESANSLERGTILSVSDDLIGAKRKIQTGCGSLHFEAYFDEVTGEPMETFINVGSTGSCERNLQLISRLMSLSLRAGVSVDDIIDQCKSIKPCPSYVTRRANKNDVSKGSSCPSAIGFALEDLCDKIKERCFADFDINDEDKNYQINYKDNYGCNNCDKQCSGSEDKQKIEVESIGCPKCGEPMIFEGGCSVCKACGYSPCES